MTALVAFLSQNVGQIIVIAAGYQKDIRDTFMAINEGIPRRFPNVVVLSPMSDEQLLEIFYAWLARKGIQGPSYQGDDKRHVLPDADAYLRQLMAHDQPQAGGTRDIFKYESSDMVNLSNDIFTFMLTRKKGAGIRELDKCSLIEILNKLVYERTKLYLMSSASCVKFSKYP